MGNMSPVGVVSPHHPPIFMGMARIAFSMKRIEAMVPEPLVDDIEAYGDREGYENTSQTIRALLRAGLSAENKAYEWERIAESEREEIVERVLERLE